MTIKFADFSATFVEGFEQVFPAVAIALKKWPRNDTDSAVISRFLNSGTQDEKEIRQLISNLYYLRYTPSENERLKELKEESLEKICDAALMISRGDRKKYQNFALGVLKFLRKSPLEYIVLRNVLQSLDETNLTMLHHMSTPLRAVNHHEKSDPPEPA